MTLLAQKQRFIPGQMRDWAIWISQLGKHFGGLFAIDDVSLEIGSAECLMIVAPSDCGKTKVVNHYPASIGLTRFAHHDPYQLSSGTRQQVSIARPRDIMEPQRSPEFGGLVDHIWSSLREEVQKARDQKGGRDS
jgi:ABC-type sulfate/molybdate transport systems ATPase subunit